MLSLAKLQRPYPPPDFIDPDAPDAFLPAPELRDWTNKVFIFEGSRLTNPDHAHLQMASIGIIWTNIRCDKQMLPVVGQMKLCRPNPMQDDWAKARELMQLRGWFDHVPDFMMTLYAPYLVEADNATFCAVIEHELYHARLKFITRKGKPIWGIIGHDVEEFVGVTARYGVGASAGRTRDLVEAARKKPLIGEADLRAMCGTCLRLAA